MLHHPFSATPDLHNQNLQGRNLEVGISQKYFRCLMLLVRYGKHCPKDILLLTPFSSEGH